MYILHVNTSSTSIYYNAMRRKHKFNKYIIHMYANHFISDLNANKYTIKY